MTIITVCAVTAAIALVVLTVVVIRTSIELRRTAIRAREFMDHAESEVKPVLADLHQTLGNIKLLSEEAAGRIGDVKSFMEAAGDTGRNLSTINHVVGSVTGLVGKSSLWMTGLKVAGKYALNRFTKKRRNKHGE